MLVRVEEREKKTCAFFSTVLRLTILLLLLADNLTPTLILIKCQKCFAIPYGKTIAKRIE